MTSYKMRKMNGDKWEPPAKLFCTLCSCSMSNAEPMSPRGEFWHQNNGCKNSDLVFYLNSDGQPDDEAVKAKIQLFVRKKWRKYQK